jgi:hypothetical protein
LPDSVLRAAKSTKPSCLKDDIFRYSRFFATSAIVHPTCGQIQASVDQHAALRAGICKKCPNLTILDFAGCSAVLPTNACRLVSFFQKACFVEDANSVCFTKLVDHVLLRHVSRFVFVPRRAIQKSLHLVWRGIAHHLRKLPAVFALCRADQPAQVFQPLFARLLPSIYTPIPAVVSL